MTVLDEITNDTLTLGQRLAEGPLPIPEALRYATLLAEALRQIHDEGRTFGALTPSNIAINSSGLELIVPQGQPEAITHIHSPGDPSRPPRGRTRSDISPSARSHTRW
jgi:hypothetical protein